MFGFGIITLYHERWVVISRIWHHDTSSRGLADSMEIPSDRSAVQDESVVQINTDQYRYLVFL